MITTFLLAYMLNGVPQVDAYSTEIAMCSALSGHVSDGVVIYKLDTSKRSEPVLAKGVCKPVQQFVTEK